MKRQLRTRMIPMVVFSLIVGMVTQANAQWRDSMGGSFNNPISSSLSSAIWGNMQMQNNLRMQRMMMESQQRAQQGPSGRVTAQGSTRTGHGTGVSGSAALGKTTFHPARSPLMPQQLAQLMGKTPNQRQQVEKLLALCLELFNQFEPKARPERSRAEPIHDVARSLGYYIAMNYYIYAQGDSAMPKEVTAQQYEALCRMLRSVLLQNAQFQALNDQQKQQLHEALAILGSLPILGYQQAKQQKSQEQLATALQLARQNLANLGMSPERMQFTDAGLNIK